MGRKPKARSEGLIVEHLGDEMLVYDTERNEAHALRGAGAAEFLAAEDEVSRREVLQKLALAGVAAAGTGALVKTIVAPTPAQAASQCNQFCASAADCAGAAGGCTCCCVAITVSCQTAANCTAAGFPCRQPTSDRALKHHLTPVDPQDMLAALG